MLRPNWFHVLAALAREEMHGSAIADDVLEQTDGGIRLWPATLYRTLDHMAEDGLIEELTGDRHPSGESQKRRYYRVTPAGRQQLAEAAEQMSAYAATVRARLTDVNQ
jgi:DNA-binding PadR family transcriptional regulator